MVAVTLENNRINMSDFVFVERQKCLFIKNWLCYKVFSPSFPYRYQGHIGAALVLGGVDHTGAHLYSIYPHGSTNKLPYATMGSGSLAAMSVFEDRYKVDMEVNCNSNWYFKKTHQGYGLDWTRSQGWNSPKVSKRRLWPFPCVLLL